jgi:hypothetical protein
MAFIPLYELFPEIAKRETRTIHLLNDARFDLPSAEYAFIEMFCDEPGCDCRRVFFSVVSTLTEKPVPLAVISYGWETYKFYEKWSHGDEPEIIKDLMEPKLNISSPQSQFANGILDLFCKMLLTDRAYIDRVKRHYRIFREKIDG